jgi:hypothetical protein
LIQGGPIGALKGAIVGAAGGGVRATAANVQESFQNVRGQVPAGYAATVAAQSARARAGSTAVTHPIGSSPAGTPHGGMVPYRGGLGKVPGEVGAPVRGYHWDKKTGTFAVKNRHMNPYNPRALGRAERRVRRFVHMAQHLIRWVHPHKTGRAVPKFGGRKRRAR